MHLKSFKQRASSVPSTFSAAQYFPDVSSTHASFLSAIRKLLWYVNTMWLSIQFPPWPYFSSKSTMTVRAFSAVSALSSPSLEQKEDIILGTLNFRYSFSAWVFKLTWNAVATSYLMLVSPGKRKDQVTQRACLKWVLCVLDMWRNSQMEIQKSRERAPRKCLQVLCGVLD